MLDRSSRGCHTLPRCALDCWPLDGTSCTLACRAYWRRIMRNSRVAILAGGLTLAIVARPAHAANCRHLPAARAPRVSPNDNRHSSGTLRDGVVSLRLVMREASWYPDGANGCALQVRAFAEEGKPARVPGPLIRVRTGTDVSVTVRNALATSLWVRGLQTRDV